MMPLLGAGLVLAGWWLLAIAMPTREPVAASRRRVLRAGGTAALLASLGCFVAGIGIEQGPVFWACALMLSALAVALVRALADRHRQPRDRRSR